jgi:hypothetical protein
LTRRSGLSRNPPTSKGFSLKTEAKLNEIKDQRIKKLEDKLIQENEVIAELLEENVKAKKANGDL